MTAEHLRSNPNDLELLAAWREGDLVAADALLSRHYAAIHRFFHRRVGGDCEDLIQATFLGCIEAIDRFRAEASFRTLLYAIAWNKLRRHIRDQPRTFEPLADPLAMTGPTIRTQIAAGQAAQRLHGAMGRLSAEARTMLELHYFEGMPVQDLALVLELPVSTVKTKMRRARLQLASELQAGEQPGGRRPSIRHGQQ